LGTENLPCFFDGEGDPRYYPGSIPLVHGRKKGGISSSLHSLKERELKVGGQSYPSPVTAQRVKTHNVRAHRTKIVWKTDRDNKLEKKENRKTVFFGIHRIALPYVGEVGECE